MVTFWESEHDKRNTRNDSDFVIRDVVGEHFFHIPTLKKICDL